MLLHDFFVMSGDPGRHDEADHLARVARCERVRTRLRLEVAPRFDFGAIVPDLREVANGLYTACGSNKGLLIHCNVPLTVCREDAALLAEATLHQGDVLELSIRFVRPELLREATTCWRLDQGALAPRLEQTLRWWAAWERSAGRPPHTDALTRRMDCERPRIVLALLQSSIRPSPQALSGSAVRGDPLTPCLPGESFVPMGIETRQPPAHRGRPRSDRS